MSYVAKIDEGSCIAQADCVEVAPDVFEVADHARVVGEGTDELLLAAAGECPVEAITILDAADGRQVYP